MFERYTEKARRTIFFARYEASQFGSPVINTEHLLLGLAREDDRLYHWIPKAKSPELIRQRVESWVQKRPSISTSVDMPLSDACKHVLHKTQDEANRLNSKFIGTEHLFLALLQEPNCRATALLQELGAELDRLRVEFAKMAQDSLARDQARAQFVHSEFAETITIHGEQRPLKFVLETVVLFRSHKWHWRKQAWTPRDAVSERKTGKLSFDLTLAEDSENFELVKGRWEKDHCVVCHWELFESKEEAEHGTGYTNGRDWLCIECYEKFWGKPDLIRSLFSDIT